MSEKIIRVPVSLAQSQFIDQVRGKTPIAKFFRDLVAQKYTNFPMDKATGVRDDYSKMSLLGDVLQLINPHLPMNVDDLHKMVMDYLIDNSTKPIVNDAMVLLHTRGIYEFFKWFGMPPMYTDETKTTISILRIMDGDE